MSKTKLCKCKGDNPNCPICEGTGIVLFDEKYDEVHNLFADDEKYFNEELEEE